MMTVVSLKIYSEKIVSFNWVLDEIHIPYWKCFLLAPEDYWQQESQLTLVMQASRR